MVYLVTVDGKPHEVELQKSERGWRCRLDGRDIEVDAVLARHDVLSLIVDGRSYEVKREQTSRDMHLWVGSARFCVEVRDPRSLDSRTGSAQIDKGAQRLVAPMAGRVVRILAAEGSEIEANQGVVVVEAMKMMNEIRSPKSGILTKVLAQPGRSVNAGDVLAIVE